MSIHGVEIYYTVQGEGIPIIFVHPPVLSSTSFIFQIRELSTKFRVIAFDIRGHGKSQASQESLTYPIIVADMEELMNGLGVDKAYLCGYSTGGSIVLEFLLEHPDRAYGGILIGGISEIHDFRLKARIFLGISLSTLGAFRILALLLAWSNSIPSIFWRTFQDAKRGNSKNAEQYYRYSLTYDCTKQLPKINIPILLLYGEQDKGFHSYGHLLHESLPKNELVFIGHVKHQIPTKATSQLHDEIVRFIDKHTG